MTNLFPSVVLSALLAASLTFPIRMLDAQEPLASGGCVSEDLPVDHWTVELIQRLESLGLAERTSSDRVLQACRVDEILAEAEVDPSAGSAMSARIARWRELLAAERERSDTSRAAPAFALSSMSIGLGMGGTRGAAAPGFAEFEPTRTGAEPMPDGVRMTSSLEASARVFGRAHLSTGFTSSAEDMEVDRLEVTTPLGPLSATIGRGYNRIGDAKGGSIIFSGVAPLDRIELSTREQFHLPWFLRYAGGIGFTTLLGIVQDDRHEDEPYFWAMRGSVRPHPRLEFSVNRAALFGGDQRLRLNNLGMMLLGRVQGKGFEDQIVSVEGWLRLPTEDFIPLTLVAEWGAEDAAGAWWAVPGLVVSLQAPSLPGASGVSAAIEYAYFGTSCCLNPEWYRHWSFPGSWALGDLPMGHPLGGNGSELLLTSSAVTHDARVRVRNDLFSRHRRSENLYVPGREGRSTGFRSHALWRITEEMDLDASVRYETGNGWSERTGTFSGKFYF